LDPLRVCVVCRIGKPRSQLLKLLKQKSGRIYWPRPARGAQRPGAGTEALQATCPEAPTGESDGRLPPLSSQHAPAGPLPTDDAMAHQPTGKGLYVCLDGTCAGRLLKEKKLRRLFLDHMEADCRVRFCTQYHLTEDIR